MKFVSNCSAPIHLSFKVHVDICECFPLICFYDSVWQKNAELQIRYLEHFKMVIYCGLHFENLITPKFENCLFMAERFSFSLKVNFRYI